MSLRSMFAFLPIACKHPHGMHLRAAAGVGAEIVRGKWRRVGIGKILQVLIFGK